MAIIQKHTIFIKHVGILNYVLRTRYCTVISEIDDSHMSNPLLANMQKALGIYLKNYLRQSQTK